MALVIKSFKISGICRICSSRWISVDMRALKFYVALTVFPRLQSVLRLPARQSNILLEPTTPASQTSFVSNGVAAQQIVRL